MLVSASGGNTATLRYDPLGRLFEAVEGANTTQLLEACPELVSGTGRTLSANTTVRARSRRATSMALAEGPFDRLRVIGRYWPTAAPAPPTAHCASFMPLRRAQDRAPRLDCPHHDLHRRNAAALDLRCLGHPGREQCGRRRGRRRAVPVHRTGMGSRTRDVSL